MWLNFTWHLIFSVQLVFININILKDQKIETLEICLEYWNEKTIEVVIDLWQSLFFIIIIDGGLILKTFNFSWQVGLSYFNWNV